MLNEQDEVTQLDQACDRMAEQYALWPKVAKWQITNSGPSEEDWISGSRPKVPPGFTQQEYRVALELRDLHSMLCAHLLEVCWRAQQLTRTLQASLRDSDLVVAASMARALIETASSFLIETCPLILSWEQFKNREPNLTPQAAFEYRKSIFEPMVQVFYGTRVPKGLAGEVPTRTNVLSLVDKAEKQALGIKLRELYDEISDVVHPSFGSHETFMGWMQVKDAEEIGPDGRTRGDINMHVASDARHLHDLMTMFGSLEPQSNMFDPQKAQKGEFPISSMSQRLESIIREGAIWALEQLTTKLPQQRLQCDDMYLTLKLSLMKADYFGDETWGIVGYDPSKIVGMHTDSSGDMFLDVLTPLKED